MNAPEDRFHGGFRHGFEEPEPERNAEQCGKHQPARAAQMDILPILNEHHDGHGNRNQHGQRRSHLNRQGQCEQRHGHQRFSEAESGTNERGKTKDRQDDKGGPTGERWNHAVLGSGAKMLLLASILA